MTFSSLLLLHACRERSAEGPIDHVDAQTPDAGSDAARQMDAVMDAGYDADATVNEPPRVVVGTWNLHNFSQYGADEWRLSDIAAFIEGLDVDVLAVQELQIEEGSSVEDDQAFDALLSETPSFTGVHNPWPTFDTCVGLLTRTSTATVLDWQTILDTDSWAFPRPPLHAVVQVSKQGRGIELDVIVVHLKAFQDSVDRRRLACQQLDAYMADHPDRSFIVMGDFNDDPYDPPDLNSFLDTLLGREPTYYFVTASLPPESVTSVSYYHWVGGEQITGEFLDHAVMTGDLVDMYGSVTPTIYGRPESEYDAWESDYSDHFPVTVELLP